MLSSIFLPAYYAGTANAIGGLEYLALEKACSGLRGKYPTRNHKLSSVDIDDVEKRSLSPPPPPPPLKPNSNLHFTNSPLRPLEIDMHKQKRSVSEHPIRHRGARAPISDASFSVSHPPRILESLPKSMSFDEDPDIPGKSQRPKVRVGTDKLNRLYKTYSKKFTMKMANQKRATSINSKSQKKAEKTRETLETISKIESAPCMFSTPQDLSALAMQKAEVLRAISSHKGKKLVESTALLTDEKSLHGYKSYLGKYYSLRYLDKIAECEADKAIVANAKKLAADVGLSDDSKTKLWVKITLDDDGYNISIRAPLDFLFEESPVHDTLRTIYETASERNAACDT